MRRVVGWACAHQIPRWCALALLILSQILPPLVTQRRVFTITAILDITGSMNARDLPPGTRIDAEKRSLRQLLRDLPCGSRLGAGIFVEAQPFLLFEPVDVCENFSAIDGEIQAIDWRMGWDSESHIAETLRASLHLANDLQSDLIFITDGQETPPLDWSAPIDFTQQRNTVRGLIAGAGGHTLVPIPKFDAMGHETGIFKPGDVPVEHDGLFQGNEHLTAVDEPHLRKLAQETGLLYVPLATTNLLAALIPTATLHQQPTKTSIAWVPATLAWLLLLFSSLPPRNA